MAEQNKGVKGDASSAAGDPILAAAERPSGRDETLDADTERRASRLQSEIERTRADMGETVEAIQERLRPGNVVSRAAGSVRDAAVRKVKQMTSGDRNDLPRRAADWYRGNGLVEHVRDNPIPAAIAVGSLAWLAFGRRPTRDYVGPPPYERFQDREVLYGDRSPERREEIAGDHDEGYAESWRSESLSSAASAMRRAGDMASEAGNHVRAVGSRTQRRVRQMTRENTLTAALVAAGIGVAIGLALPETERENELMGEAKESIVNRAKSAARDTIGRVEQTAEKVQRTAGDAIRSIADDASQSSQARRKLPNGSKRT